MSVSYCYRPCALCNKNPVFLLDSVWYNPWFYCLLCCVFDCAKMPRSQVVAQMMHVKDTWLRELLEVSSKLSVDNLSTLIGEAVDKLFENCINNSEKKVDHLNKKLQEETNECSALTKNFSNLFKKIDDLEQYSQIAYREFLRIKLKILLLTALIAFFKDKLNVHLCLSDIDKSHWPIIIKFLSYQYILAIFKKKSSLRNISIKEDATKAMDNNYLPKLKKKLATEMYCYGLWMDGNISVKLPIFWRINL